MGFGPIFRIASNRFSISWPGSDLGSKKGGLLNMFGAGRKEPESEPELKKNTNWWTL